MTPEDVARSGRAIIDTVGEAIIGKRDVVRLVLAAALADGHVLVEDLPGLGKTLLVRSLARATGLGHARIQFTPDLMPMDITGSIVLDPVERRPEFRPGPIFSHLLLADEINRAPAKTQAALLEAMQERQVTADGVTRPLERPFLVVATQNPIEYEGTYPLPEAQLDRFLIRAEMGYPGQDSEWEVLRSRAERGTDDVVVDQVLDRTQFLDMQAGLETVHVSEAVGRYMVSLVDATRRHRRVRVGASPRGSLALMKVSRAVAALDGRDYVLPDDVQEVAVPALAHRLVLRPEAWAQGVDERAVVEECCAEVPVPSVAPEAG
ncbi:MAG TPA: MoxR family ATPase [Acidimicrobiia bacterium]|nr:MoxR family ATPase [Acidimicrobiia bacterium]